MSEMLMLPAAAQAAAEQIMSRCDALAEISETPGQLTRVLSVAGTPACQCAGGGMDARSGHECLAG